MSIFNGQMEQQAENAIALMRDLYSVLDNYRLNFEDTKNAMYTVKNPAKAVADTLEITFNDICEDIENKRSRLVTFDTDYGTAFATYYGADWSKRLADCIAGLTDLDTFFEGKIKAGYEDASGNELSKEMSAIDRTAISNEIKTVLDIS